MDDTPTVVLGDDLATCSPSASSPVPAGKKGSTRGTGFRSMSPNIKKHADPNASMVSSKSSGVFGRSKGSPAPGSDQPRLADFAVGLNRMSAAEEQRTRGASLAPMLGGGAVNPFNVSKVEPVFEPPAEVLSKYLTVSDEIKNYNAPIPSGKRPMMVAIRRHKMTLVGAGEAGKTSIRKCFAESTAGVSLSTLKPSNLKSMFVKTLPEVGTTTGIDVQHHRAKVTGNASIDIEINDFAGQEVYHSHSLFLSNRTMFLFVWNMANVEQTFDDYGISEEEEDRLKRWADLIQAKCPGAPLVVVGTHKDELRDTSQKTVRLILNKVCKIIQDYVETLRLDDVKNISVGGSFCVSCRDKTVIPENSGGPTKMKELFQWAAELCHKYSKTDHLYPGGCVPRYVVALVATLEKLRGEMETVLLPMKTYNNLTKQLGIPKELLHKITTMLHDWGVLYLFDRTASRLNREDCVFLHPLWLSKMVAAVFTYAHSCTAPDYERATMEITDMDADQCDEVEPTKLILEGVLSQRLATVMFSQVLRELKRDANEQSIDICFTMLSNLDLVYRNTYIPEVGPYYPIGVDENAPEFASGPQYYIPSIFPRDAPKDLDVHLSRLLGNVGTHQYFTLTPFPAEFMQMLHCRVHALMMRLQVNIPMQHTLKRHATHGVAPVMQRVQNNWRDAMWIAGGGGEGQDLGRGPLRGLVAADFDGRRIDIWTAGGDDADLRMMTDEQLISVFDEGVRDLSHKFPGMRIEKHTDVAVEASEELPDETFEFLGIALRPCETRFLMSELGFTPTTAQVDKLKAAEKDEGDEAGAASPGRDQLKVSLLLDKVVKTAMVRANPQQTSTESQE